MIINNINRAFRHYVQQILGLLQEESTPGITDCCSILKDLLFSSFEFIPGNESKENIGVEILYIPSSLQVHMPCIRIWDGKAKVYGYIAALAPEKTKKTINLYSFPGYYKRVFPNLILTDFFEFQYYRETRKLCTARTFHISDVTGITNKTKVTNTRLFLKELQHFMRYCPKKSKNFTLIDLQQGLALKTFYLRDCVLTPLMSHLHKSGSKCELIRLYRAYCYFFDLELTFKEFSAFLTHVMIDGLLRSVIFYSFIDSKEAASQNNLSRVVEFAKFTGMDDRRLTLFKFLSSENSQLPAAVKWMLDDIYWFLCGFDFKQIGFSNNNPWLLEGETLLQEDYFFKPYFEKEEYIMLRELLKKAGIFSGDKKKSKT